MLLCLLGSRLSCLSGTITNQCLRRWHTQRLCHRFPHLHSPPCLRSWSVRIWYNLFCLKWLGHLHLKSRAESVTPLAYFPPSNSGRVPNLSRALFSVPPLLANPQIYRFKAAWAQDLGLEWVHWETGWTVDSCINAGWGYKIHQPHLLTYSMT